MHKSNTRVDKYVFKNKRVLFINFLSIAGNHFKQHHKNYLKNKNIFTWQKHN